MKCQFLVNLIKRFSLIFIFGANVAGCIPLINKNMDAAPVSQAIYNQCFSTNINSYLIDYCSPGINYKIIAENTNKCVPNNKRDFLGNQEHFRTCKKGFFNFTNNKCKFDVLEYILSSTQFTVINITSLARGSSGRCWSIKGRFLDGNLAGNEFYIPSCISLDSDHPLWFIEHNGRLSHNKEYINQCPSN